MSKKEIENLEVKLAKLQLDFNKQADEITNSLKLIRNRQSLETQSKDIQTGSEGEVYSDAQEEQTSNNDDSHTTDIVIGDWVQVTNDYKYIDKGKIGIVYKFNKKRDRLWLRTKKGENIQRAPWNVRIVNEPRA